MIKRIEKSWPWDQAMPQFADRFSTLPVQWSRPCIRHQ